MPVKRELTDYLARASSYLDRTIGSMADARVDIEAILRLADVATDDTAKALIERFRRTVQEALDAFEATDFKTADLEARMVP